MMVMMMLKMMVRAEDGPEAKTRCVTQTFGLFAMIDRKGERLSTSARMNVTKEKEDDEEALRKCLSLVIRQR